MPVIRGRDMRVFIDNGAAVLLEVENQMDSSLNLGRGAAISVTKNSKNAYQTEEGATLTYKIQKEIPARPSHTRLRTLASTGAVSPAVYKHISPGGESYTGNVVVTMGEEEANVEGILETPVTFSFINDPIIGITT